MLQDLILSWFSNLLVGTLLGTLVGLVLGLLIFLGLAKLGTWAHPRLNGGWRVATLSVVGLFFVVIGGLTGATWGFCRAAETKLLATQVKEGFHHICCRPAAAVIASQRWQFCLFLLAFLLLPPLPFHFFRKRHKKMTTGGAGIKT